MGNGFAIIEGVKFTNPRPRMSEVRGGTTVDGNQVSLWSEDNKKALKKVLENRKNTKE